MKDSGRKKYIDWVEDYLRDRRRWGYELAIEGRQLESFAQYLDGQEFEGPLTQEVALLWATINKSATPLTWAKKLETVRCFAKYLLPFIPGTAVPSTKLIGPAHRRVTPFIYNDGEVNALLNACLELKSKLGLRKKTIYSFIGLLAATGVRPLEALHLSKSDVDLQNNCLLIRETKFRQTRLVPLDISVTSKLRGYSKIRDKLVTSSQSNNFFLLDDGSSLNSGKACYAFQCMRKRLNWSTPYDGKRLPRLYDLRHTFICNRIFSWYQEGKNINVMLPILSTYVGHRRVTDTYWYITGTPKLMAVASKRFETFSLGGENDEG